MAYKFRKSDVIWSKNHISLDMIAEKQMYVEFNPVMLWFSLDAFSMDVVVENQNISNIS